MSPLVALLASRTRNNDPPPDEPREHDAAFSFCSPLFGRRDVDGTAQSHVPWSASGHGDRLAAPGLFGQGCLPFWSAWSAYSGSMLGMWAVSSRRCRVWFPLALFM